MKGSASRVALPAEDRLSFRLQVAGKFKIAEDAGLLPDGLLDNAQVRAALRSIVRTEAALDDRALHAPVVDPIAHSLQGCHHGVGCRMHVAGKQLCAAIRARSLVTFEKFGVCILARAITLVLACERLREDIELVGANRLGRRFVEWQVEHGRLHRTR